MKRFTLILSLLCFVCFGVNAQVLKVSDAPEGENWAENTTWYLIQNMKGGYVSTDAAYCNTEGKLRLSNSNTPADDNANALWCVVGDETTGYQFYNKASGTGKVLYASRALNAGTASFNMAEKTGVQNEFFDIAKSQKNGYLVVKDHDNQNNYWNNRDNNLAYWNDGRATNDDGSSFAFLNVEEFNMNLAAAEDLLEMTKFEFSAIQLLTEENANDVLYSNAYCTDTQWGDQFSTWTVLTDDNPGTFFHSEYASGKSSTDGLNHYIRIDLGENNDVSEFYFSYTTRNYSGECDPKNMVLEGSATENGEYTLIKEYKNLSSAPANVFTSDALTNNGYRYLRFRVTETYDGRGDASGNDYFYIAELRVYTPTVIIDAAYEAYKNDLIQFYTIYNAANSKKTGSVIDRAIALYALNSALDAADRVLNADYYALIEKIAALQGAINNEGDAVGQYADVTAIETAVAEANAVLENEESTPGDYAAALEALNALEMPAINLPKDGHFYLFRNVVKENGYMYVSLADNVNTDEDEAGHVCWASSTTPANVGIWECEVENGNIYFKNVHTASYFSSTESYKPTTLSETEKAIITFAALGERQVNIMVNGAQLHAQNAGGHVVPWGDGKDTPSAWYVEEIASPVNHTLTVGAAGYATLMLGYNATIPAIDGEDCGVFVATIEGEYAVLKEIEGVLPANTAVIVKAAPGDYTFAYTTETATVKNNDLRGTLYNKNMTEDAYVLGKDENNVAYLGLAVKTDGVWLNNANKAYLPAPADTQGVKSYSLRFEGEGTTAIENVEVENEVKAIYDLTGRRVEVAERGIYIINGKKVLVK